MVQREQAKPQPLPLILPNRIDMPTPGSILFQLPGDRVNAVLGKDGIVEYHHTDERLQLLREAAISASVRLEEQDRTLFTSLGKNDHVHYGLLGEMPQEGPYNVHVLINPSSLTQIRELKNNPYFVLACADARFTQLLLNPPSDVTPNVQRTTFMQIAGGGIHAGQEEIDAPHLITTHVEGYEQNREADVRAILEYITALNAPEMTITAHTDGCAAVTTLAGGRIDQVTNPAHLIDAQQYHAVSNIEYVLMADALLTHGSHILPLGVRPSYYLLSLQEGWQNISGRSSTRRRLAHHQSVTQPN